MARPRSIHYDAQREAILQHAAALFAHEGFPATSMNAVARATGLSKATLYHYFPDKYSLLLEVIESHVQHLAQVVADVMAQPLQAGAGTDPGSGADLARLRALIHALVTEYADAQHAHRLLTEDVRFLTDPDRERVLQHERRMVGDFASLIARIRPDLAPLSLSKPLTMLLFGMVNWMFTWMKPERALGYGQMADLVEQLFIHGLGGVLPPAGLPADFSPPPTPPETTHD